MARGIRKLTRPRRDREQAPRARGLRELLDALPEDLKARALTHASWVEKRPDSYGRLAFLGDSVLGLAVAEYLYRRFPRSDIGRLTKMHGQVVSGRACARVASDIGLPELLESQATGKIEGGIELRALLASERAMASICEAVIGAVYLHHGFVAASEATVTAFADELTVASERLFDFKSALQERAARNGSRVKYDVTGESGPPHDRYFEVEASVEGTVVGRGSGRSKKAAEQAAAAEALEALGPKG